MKFNIIYFTALAFLLNLYSCKEATNTAQILSEQEVVEEPGYRVTKKQFDASGFKLAPIEKHDFLMNLAVPGVLSVPSKNQSDVSSLIGGKVNQYSFVEGQWVKKGQLLFSLSNPEIIDLQEQYLVGKNQVEYLRAEQARLRALLEENLTTQKEFAAVNANLQKERTLLNIRTKKLALYGFDTAHLTSDNVQSSIALNAPISGYIRDIKIQPGAFLNATETALTIVSNANIQVVLSVLERDAADIKIGQQIQFSLPNNPNKKYPGKVTLLSNEIESNNTIKVYCTITEKPTAMKSGMYVNGFIGLSNKQLDALPESALVKAGNDYKVLVLTSSDEHGYMFEDVVVKKIIASDGKVAIEEQEPLVGKQILVHGAYDIY